MSLETQKFKRGATVPIIGLNVTGCDTDPTAKTATFYMRTDADVRAGKTGTPVVDGGVAVISDVEAQADGTYNFTITYQWVAADVATVGCYGGEFKVTLSASRLLILPIDDDYIPIELVDNVETGG